MKNYLIIILNIIIVSLVLPLINAHFVCGEVDDGINNISAQWFPVRVYYPEDLNEFTTCEISPAGNKYCCDAQSIPGKTWQVGDEVIAEIIDNSTGYIAEPVNLITTGEGFDVFPEMELKEVINLIDPKVNLFVNDSKALINASFIFPYNEVRLETNNETIFYCENCSTISEFVNLSYGTNYFKLTASYLDRIFSKIIDLVLLDFYIFERDFSCDKCYVTNSGRIIVGSNQIANVSIKLNLSHEISDSELIEYVPIEWKIIDTYGGEIIPYSDTHNKIAWIITGDYIDLNYLVESPKILFFPKKFDFMTDLDGQLINEEEVIVSRFFRFFPFGNEIENLDGMKIYPKVHPKKPAVIRSTGSMFERIAIFPKKVRRNVEINFKENNENLKDRGIENVMDSYIIETNLNNNNIEKILVEFRISKDYMESNDYYNVSLIITEDGEEWIEIDKNLIEEDDNNYYYKNEVDTFKEIAIIGVKKNNFFDIFSLFG